LNRNGRDLKESVLKFVEEAETLAIFVPYIKLNVLEEILSQTKNCRYIVVRWEVKDLLERASDLEIYEVCKEKKISLFRNARLHLKLYLDADKAYLTTANISSRALNYGKYENYNYEMGVKIDKLELEDRIYLQNILDESQLIDDRMMEAIKEQLSLLALDEEGGDFEFKNIADKKDFLLSSLPMSEDINKLKEYYKSRSAPTQVEYDCMVHDLSLYTIPTGLKEEEFLNRLSVFFFEHPFIQAFLKEINSAGGELYFGRVRQWLAANCADSPTPRAWEVTKNVQILYHWIETLGSGKFEVDVPGTHSQRIFLK